MCMFEKVAYDINMRRANTKQDWQSILGELIFLISGKQKYTVRAFFFFLMFDFCCIGFFQLNIFNETIYAQDINLRYINFTFKRECYKIWTLAHVI